MTEELNKYVCKKIFGVAENKESVAKALTDPTNKESIYTKIEQIRTILLSVNNAGVIDIIEQLPSPECSDDKLVAYYVFLNDASRLHARYTKNKGIMNWDDMPEFVLKFPELATRQNKQSALDFWYSLEERETVIGYRCSELTLRLASMKAQKPLPIRYLYQARDVFFLEEKKTLLDLIRLVDKAETLERLDDWIKNTQAQSFLILVKSII